MQLSPVILFAYNRADKTQQVLDALAANDLATQTDVVVFRDAPRNLADQNKVEEVDLVLENESLKNRFKSFEVKRRRINHGLKINVIAGVNEVFDYYDRVIVLEDDTVPAKGFLQYMNQQLITNESKPKIFAISGFNFPEFFKKTKARENFYFFCEKPCSWGWATWKDRWERVNFDPNSADILKFLGDKKGQKEFKKLGDNLPEMLRFAHEGKIDSWATFFTFHAFKCGGLTVYPAKPLIKNIGFDGGTHFQNDDEIAKIYDKVGFNFDEKEPTKISVNEDFGKLYLKMSTTGTTTKIDKKLKKKLLNLFFGFIIGFSIGVIF